MGWLGSLVAPLLLAGLLWSGAVHADIDPAEYERNTSIISFGVERERLKEAEVERERERLEAEAEARRQVEEKARLEARPYPAKLLEARCTGCHAATHYENKNHAWLGWWLVVLRMEYFNELTFNPGERSVIVAHLNKTRPGDGQAILTEYGAVAISLFGAALLAWRGMRLNRLKRQRTMK